MDKDRLRKLVALRYGGNRRIMSQLETYIADSEHDGDRMSLRDFGIWLAHQD
jgi:hypothetical protein